MKICLGKELVEEVKKKNSENEKNLLKNRNSEDINELDADDVYFHSNAVKNIKLGTNVVNRIYLNNSIVYELQDTIDLNLFHSLVPSATATSIIFDKLENQDISNYNLVGYCDVNNHIAVYQNNTEYLILNVRNAVIYAPDSCSLFLYNYTVLTLCVFSHFNTNQVKSMSGMFGNCYRLTSLDVSHFNTDNVSNMAQMFYYCNNLTSLDVSHFNTKNITNMSYMFDGCYSLTSINVSHFNTNKVINMTGMFGNCRSITSLDISNFNIMNLKNVSYMFKNCSNIQTIISNTFPFPLIYSVDMFLNNLNLVGGNGTTYDANHIDAEYARIDGENGLPGYFTAPANK